MAIEHQRQHRAPQTAWLTASVASDVSKPGIRSKVSRLSNLPKRPQSNKRLHLQEGPIDLVIKATGSGDACDLAYRSMETTFEGLLSGLVDELPALRTPMSELAPAFRRHRQVPPFQGLVARRMYKACLQSLHQVSVEVTPMAAVAGAVADHVLQAAASIPGLTSLYVNNGGDIAFHLQPGENFICGICDYEKAMADSCQGSAGKTRTAQIVIDHDDPVRGIASSGRLGRSFSLGIADSVTVLAENAAIADVIATLVANQVDLPDHPQVERISARELDPDTDLGDRRVVTELGELTNCEVHTALRQGARYAERLLQSGLIHAAYLSLRGVHVGVGQPQQRAFA